MCKGSFVTAFFSLCFIDFEVNSVQISRHVKMSVGCTNRVLHMEAQRVLNGQTPNERHTRNALQ